jgi:hypothetical protein
MELQPDKQYLTPGVPPRGWRRPVRWAAPAIYEVDPQGAFCRYKDSYCGQELADRAAAATSPAYAFATADGEPVAAAANPLSSVILRKKAFRMTRNSGGHSPIRPLPAMTSMSHFIEVAAAR